MLGTGPTRRQARQGIVRDEQGVTAIEFAMVAPVLFLLMLGIIEFSMIMFTETVVESATNTSSRLGKTNYVPGGVTRRQAIVNSVTQRTAGLLDSSKITVTTKVYKTFGQIDQPEPCISPRTAPCGGTAGVNYTDVNGNGSWDADMGLSGEGNAGEVVVYTVNYPWKVMTPMISAIIGGTFPISARTVVRNEPYDS